MQQIFGIDIAPDRGADVVESKAICFCPEFPHSGEYRDETADRHTVRLSTLAPDHHECAKSASVACGDASYSMSSSILPQKNEDYGSREYW